MSTRGKRTPQRRIAIVGGGVSGLGAAWALSRHPDRFDFPAVRGPGPHRRECGHRRHAPGRRHLHPFRHFRHRVHPVDLSPHRPADAAVRHRDGRHAIQLQCEVPRPRLRPRLRLGATGAAAARNRQVSAHSATTALVRRAEPFPVQGPERPQPVQLREHGDGPEPGRSLRRLPVQDTQAHVRQLPNGHQRLRHARVSVRQVPGVLRH